jgi:hypothetical protein
LKGLEIGIFGIFDDHLVYIVVIWYILPRFGLLYQEKSGNPARQVFPDKPVFECVQKLSHYSSLLNLLTKYLYRN